MRSPITPRIMPRISGIRPGAFFGRGAGASQGATDFFGRNKKGVASQSKVKAAGSPLLGAAQNISQSLEPQQEYEGVNVNRINQIVENKVNRLIPRIAERVETQVNAFDPNELLSRIFRGGLDELQRFGQNLQSLMVPLQRTFDFIFQSRDILLKLIDQLATASKNLGNSKSPGMGLRGLKTLALAATAAYAAKITWDQIKKANDEGPPPQGGEISGTPPPMGGVEQQQSLTGGEEINTELFNETVGKFGAILSSIEKALYGEEKGSSGDGISLSPPGESTSIPVSQPMSSSGGITLPNTPPEISALMDAVSAGEGDANSIQGQGVIPGVNLENMTIEQAFQTGESYRGKGKTTTGGIGAYQFHPDFHRETAKAAGLDLNKDKFTKENQMRMMRTYLTQVYSRMGGKGGEAGIVKSIQEGNLMSDVVPKLAVDMGWPSLPGGSQPNVNTANFESTFKTAYQTYANMLAPDSGGSQFREQSSREIAQVPSQMLTDEDVQTNIIPINMGSQQQSQDGVPDKIPDGQGATIPFLVPFDQSNIHLMYSRIVYNIVDA